MDQHTASPDGTASFDEITLDLQHLRQASGPVSYAELVRRITEIRLQRGIPTAAAIPARSTIYYAFQTGRARLDTDLLRDIVIALGVDDAEVDQWVERCKNAHLASPPPKQTTPKRMSDLTSTPLVAKTAAMPLGQTTLLLLGCLAINLFGYVLVGFMSLPLYLDMVGTAIAAIVLGPWFGVAVAIVTRLSVILVGDYALQFTFVSIAGALVWGYGVRKFKMGDDFSRFFLLNIITAGTCTLIATPILVISFGGSATIPQEQMTNPLISSGLSTLGAVFVANITTSILDKLVSGMIALLVFVLLYTKMGVPAVHMPLVEKLGTLRTNQPIWTAGGGIILPRQKH